MSVTLEEHAAGIHIVRIDRPQKRNALDPATIAALTTIARDLGARADIRAVILSGGDTIFSCGIDLATPAVAEDATLIERRQALRAGPDLCRAWEEIEAITICAIDGYCIGGAFALALACDFRIMGADATLRLPEIALGMNMSWQTLPRLTALVGPARAKRITVFGDAVAATQALDWGLADAGADRGGALDLALRWAERIAALPPMPVRMTKEAVNRTSGALHAAVNHMDRDQFLLTTLSHDFEEGVAAFLGKRTPRFDDR
ncbi:enoyl-CoA hydratase/isomerase family protein [Sphingomonas colocasiae]|uniref:Enoyl-CoA hydratase/isomerase family protein n=1 Tax=Sphingomonas colocasiae TaxID=1848973 RepID=A0ABS7PN97_9SPHN|nr:enoyl-CoA hydratase/isomerase family protein [Sphingomonas colocasiae]MBY8822792.1 enoyl-CoA hydratase/isomerase family protein [Sphingomonas colocasiae]